MEKMVKNCDGTVLLCESDMEMHRCVRRVARKYAVSYCSLAVC